VRRKIKHRANAEPTRILILLMECVLLTLAGEDCSIRSLQLVLSNVN
jgi:hypothetical protein